MYRSPPIAAVLLAIAVALFAHRANSAGADADPQVVRFDSLSHQALVGYLFLPKTSGGAAAGGRDDAWPRRRLLKPRGRPI